MIHRVFRRVRALAAAVVDDLRWKVAERRLSRQEREVVGGPSELWHRRDVSGSRFFSEPGFAVLLGERGSDPSGFDGDFGDATARVTSALGQAPPEDPVLGSPRVIDGSHGRGASGWAPVVEWLGLAAAGGILGNLATDAVKAGAARFRDMVRGTKERGASILINRAGVALIALADVVEEAPSGATLWMEAAEELATVAGRDVTELGYSHTDSWLVMIVDVEHQVRYIRVVAPSGEIRVRVAAALNPFERLYLPIPD
jgi:hypothetical protein